MHLPVMDSLLSGDLGSVILTRAELFSMLFQILLVVFIITWLYLRIQGTHIAQLLKGVAVILAIYLLAEFFHMAIIARILEVLLQISIIGFIILFQPELRRLLVYLGQPDFFSKYLFSSETRNEKSADYLVHELVEAVRLLAKTKTGALIVLESPSGLGGAFLEAGVKLDARLSTELLLTIFHPNTPLHDGAVIVSMENMIVSAGVLLPLSENPKLSWQYGTRHRAAIGLSEISDSRCIVVSEETGGISMAFSGVLEKMTDANDLREQLEYIYGVKATAGSGGSMNVKSDSRRKPPISEIFSSEVWQKFFTKKQPAAKGGKKDDESKHHEQRVSNG